MIAVGYVRVHRSLLGHTAFRNDAEALAFAWMVIRAQWCAKRVRYKERLIDLKRGQLAISTRDMASAMDRDKAWIERLWKRLKSDAMIETVAEAGVTVVTICNYGKYQADRDTDETAGETPAETDARQGQDTEQGREKGKKISSGAKAPSPRAIADAFPRPDFADPQHWADFLANRKKKRLPNTSTAHAKMLADIERLADDAWPPGRILQAAAERGWAGIYDPRDDGQRNGKRPYHDRPSGPLESRRREREQYELDAG